MDELPVDDCFIEWLRNNYKISSSSQRKGTYEIMNQFIKNSSRYQKVLSIKNLPNKIHDNGGYHTEEDPFNPFIRQLIYISFFSNKVKTTILLDNFEETDSIFLLEFSFCTEDDTRFSDISKKIKEMNKEDLKKSIKRYAIKYDGSNKIELDLKASNKKKAVGIKVYDIMTKDKNNMVDFSVPLSLIKFKQFNSLISLHFKRLKQIKNNCLKYYMDVIFSPEDFRFNDKFIYHLNFYKVIDENNSHLCNNDKNSSTINSTKNEIIENDSDLNQEKKTKSFNYDYDLFNNYNYLNIDNNNYPIPSSNTTNSLKLNINEYDILLNNNNTNNIYTNNININNNNNNNYNINQNNINDNNYLYYYYPNAQNNLHYLIEQYFNYYNKILQNQNFNPI